MPLVPFLSSPSSHHVPLFLHCPNPTSEKACRVVGAIDSTHGLLYDDSLSCFLVAGCRTRALDSEQLAFIMTDIRFDFRGGGVCGDVITFASATLGHFTIAAQNVLSGIEKPNGRARDFVT